MVGRLVRWMWWGRAVFLAALTILQPLAAAAHEPAAQPPRQLVLGGALTEIAGTLHVIYGDRPLGTANEAVAAAVLHDDAGQATELIVDAAEVQMLGGFRALNGTRVRVQGTLASPAAGPDTLPLMSVSALSVEAVAAPAAAATPDAVTGSTPWVSILCKFADIASEPHSTAWVSSLVMGGAAPGLDHFWREVSYGAVNLTGSAVAGWVTLPGPRSAYLVNGSLNFGKALQDCTAAADATVYFPSFMGINLMFNGDLDGYAWGGGSTLTRDGVTKTYSVTWLPPWGYENQGVLAHEMGHGFGLPHSSGPYTATYDSRWDVMSGVWPNCPPYDSTYGCVGVHTIAYHKDLLGWIPAGQRQVVAVGQRVTVDVDPADQLAGAGRVLLVHIPIAGSATRFYTVEARRLAGYDTRLPGRAVVIHRVDTTRFDRDAQVVDPDGNGNPNDAGAMWLAGETFTDTANSITISVEAQTSTGFRVTVTNGTPVDPPPLLQALTPSSAAAGSPALTLELTGQGFVSGATVQWNGSNRTTTFVSANELRAAVTAADLAVAGAASVKVVNPGASGGTSNTLVFTINTTAGDCTDPTKFKGEYFTNVALAGTPALVRCDAAVDFAWGTGGPASGFPVDGFSARWTRTVAFAAGTYTFTTVSDDGVRLWIDGVLVIDNWTDHAPVTNTATRALAAGDHTIRMEYYEKGGGATARLSWAAAAAANLAPVQPAGWSDRVVVARAAGARTDATGLTAADTLYVSWGAGNTGGAVAGAFTTELYVDGALRGTWTTGSLAAGGQVTVTDVVLGTLGAGTHTLRLKVDAGGTVAEGNEGDNEYTKTITVGAAPPSGCTDSTKFKGEYFTNMLLAGSPTVVRCDDAVDFYWPANPTLGYPAPGIPADGFSVRWTKTVTFAAGTYTFTTISDDGVRLWVDDVLVIDNWTDHSATTNTATRTLSAGPHTLRMEYYENGGSARAYLSWTLAGTANLTPVQPSGWSDRVVVATAAGVRTDSASLTAIDSLYLSWAAVNAGAVATGGGFTTELYLNGALRLAWTTTGPVAPGAQVTVVDALLGPLPAGTHTLRLKLDAGGTVAEGNEGDNEYTKTITVGTAPPSGCTDPTKFKGEYFTNVTLSGTPALVRCDAAVNFAWGTEAPAAGFPADGFSVRWTKTITLNPGTYRFTTISDDGVRLWLDGQLLIDNWTDHAPTTNTATRTVTGGTYALKMEYYEKGGGARATLYWQGVAAMGPDTP